MGKTIAIVLFVIVIAISGYYILNAPDNRNAAEKVGDAIHELPQGADKAGRQLESRTPGEKLEDGAKDVGDDIKKSTNQQ